MKRFIIAGLALLLSGCATSVSDKLLPLDDLQATGKPRENQIVREFPLESAWDVHDVCSKVNGAGNGIIAASFLMWFSGCAKVPYNPADACIVIYKLGDDQRRQHELAHCHGYADEWY